MYVPTCSKADGIQRLHESQSQIAKKDGVDATIYLGEVISGTLSLVEGENKFHNVAFLRELQ